MAISARDLIQRALLRANLVARGETMSDEEADDGLKTLNEMIHAWETDGMHLGHVDLELTDTVQLPDSHIRGVRLLLALEMVDEYDKPLPPLLAGQADRAKRQLLNEYMVIPGAKIDRTLLDFEANRAHGRYDINEG